MLYICMIRTITLLFFLDRCHPSERCIPVFDQSNAVILPVGSDDPLVIKGECVSPCDASCTSEPQDLQCGQNGVTYYNSCYRICANKQVSIILLFCIFIIARGIIVVPHSLFSAT